MLGQGFFVPSPDVFRFLELPLRLPLPLPDVVFGLFGDICYPASIFLASSSELVFWSETGDGCACVKGPRESMSDIY